MMKITGISHLFKWENLHNWWLTKYFFAPLYITSDMEKNKNSSNDRYRTSEHNETECTLTDLLLPVLQNVNKCSLYFCKCKYCENININCVKSKAFLL